MRIELGYGLAMDHVKSRPTDVLVQGQIGQRWPLALHIRCKEAHDTISRQASHLTIHQSSPKSSVVAEIYG